MPGVSNYMRILDDKLLKEIEDLVKGWMYQEKSPKEIVYSIENFLNNKLTEQAFKLKDEK